MNQYNIYKVPCDDDRGYRVYVPRPLPIGPVAERYATVVTCHDPLCHIGIESTGAMLAGVGLAGRHQAGHTEDSFATIDVADPTLFDPAPNRPVLVDNSVHTGVTLSRAVGYLHRRFIYPGTLVTLFNYGDEQEFAMREWISHNLGMEVIALFNHADLGGS
ncbi:MAG TPA: hypothetical protein VLG11_00885 [Candidatus Saccharimonadales bacterium]|nr:hypothetical protein [Candidatus Saccharimonadales bacterium]